MSEGAGRLLDRDGVIEAFTALAERLHRRGVVADVYIVGGAAMTLAYDARRTTRDIDAVFEPHGIVLEGAREVARQLGLPPSWLNDQASVYMPREKRGPEVFSRPGLRVQSASAEHLLAMKILAGRRSDTGDIRFLLGLLGIETVEQAIATVAIHALIRRPPECRSVMSRDMLQTPSQSGLIHRSRRNSPCSAGSSADVTTSTRAAGLAATAGSAGARPKPTPITGIYRTPSARSSHSPTRCFSSI